MKALPSILDFTMRISRLATIIGILLVLASLANGSVSYLKRVGWLEHDAYSRFIEAYCSGLKNTPCMCMREPPSGSVSNDFGNLPDENYIYANNGYERLLKICKDLLFVGFILLSCYLIQTERADPPDSEALFLLLLLITNVAMGFFISLFVWGSVFALTGLRSFGFLAVALVGGWAFTGIQGITKCVAALLMLQLVLVCIEVLVGIPLRDCPHSFRAAGATVLPNSLGIFAVVAIAFYYSYSLEKSYFPFLVGLAAIILLASGSATGIVGLFVLLGFLVLTKCSRLQKKLLTVALLSLSVGLLVKLPAFIHRPDLYNSIYGRVDRLIEVLSDSSAIEILIGRGIGFGTNTAMNLATTNVINLGTTGGTADSTVTVLLTQLGLIGVVLFYGLLFWAYRRDPGARPVYLVITVASLTINITEAFPVNFLLGLALAGTLSLSLSSRAGGIALHEQSGADNAPPLPRQRLLEGGRRFSLGSLRARPPKDLTGLPTVVRGWKGSLFGY